MAPYRTSDADVVDALNVGLREARHLRGDLFYNDVLGPTPQASVAALTTPIDIEDQFQLAFVTFVVGWVELRDDQYSNDGRAATLLGQLTRELNGSMVV